MARPKKVKDDVEVVNCSICTERVHVRDYAAHVQAKHAASTQAAPATEERPAFARPPQAQIPGGFPAQAGRSATPIQGPIMASEFTRSDFLRGQDVPDGQSEVRIKARGFVAMQGVRSPLVLEIDPVGDKHYLPLNKTNIKQLEKLVGGNLQALVGKAVILATYPVNNPSTGQMTKGLYIMRVE